MKYLAGKGFIHRHLAASNIHLDKNQNCKVFSDARTLSRLVVCELVDGVLCVTQSFLNSNLGIEESDTGVPANGV